MGTTVELSELSPTLTGFVCNVQILLDTGYNLEIMLGHNIDCL